MVNPSSGAHHPVLLSETNKILFSSRDRHGRRADAEPVTMASYQLLLTKYLALANKSGAVRAERISLAKLSSWITQSRLTGFALIERGHIVIENARFRQLGKISHKAGKWIACTTGRHLRTNVSSASLPDVIVALAGRVALGNEPSMVNVRYKRDRSDHVVNVRLERGPPWAVEGGVVLALVDDVTNEVRAEEELARARRALLRRETLQAVGEIASGVVHDLANLLAAMQMRTVIMQREPGMNDAQRERLVGLTRILDDGTSLLTRLQDFAREGQQRPQVEALNLAEVIRESVEMACTSVTARAALAGTKMNIVLKLGERAYVMGVATELRQLFINLLLNARDAMPRGGTIEISARAVRRAVVVVVEDQGSGVPAAIRDRIFEPFFTTKGRNGTGLGLSMARDLMKRLGGQISVANRRQGGAAFTLRFPAATARDL